MNGFIHPRVCVVIFIGHFFFCKVIQGLLTYIPHGELGLPAELALDEFSGRVQRDYVSGPPLHHLVRNLLPRRLLERLLSISQKF